jgi:uracil phosphoribosyltransferase
LTPVHQDAESSDQSGTKQQILFFSKYPKDIADRLVILMDPMLATARSLFRS